jgi:hypothetical protein
MCAAACLQWLSIVTLMLNIATADAVGSRFVCGLTRVDICMRVLRFSVSAFSCLQCVDLPYCGELSCHPLHLPSLACMPTCPCWVAFTCMLPGPHTAAALHHMDAV